MRSVLNRIGKRIGKVLRARRTYQTYAEALECCARSGYENETLVSVVFEKTRRFSIHLRNSASLSLSPSAAFALLSLQRSFSTPGEIFVLDFGGACGAHYFLAKRFFQKDCKLTWSVVETKAMCDAGKSLENEELHFFAGIEAAARSMPRIDLIHTSGALQCVDEPEWYLRELSACGARHLLFNRAGFTKGKHEVITVHESKLSENGVGPLPPGFADRQVSYPFTFMRKDVFDAIVDQRYVMVMESADDTGMFEVNNEMIVGGGLFYKLRRMDHQQTASSAARP